jgi:hypothetical protein
VDVAAAGFDHDQAVQPGCRRELLDRALIWNQNHLRRILHQHETHFNLRGCGLDQRAGGARGGQDEDGERRDDPGRSGAAVSHRAACGGACRDLCVPITSSTSCDQAVFVDQATDLSLSSDAVQVEIGWLG